MGQYFAFVIWACVVLSGCQKAGAQIPASECGSDDPEHLCLALKYVSFEDSAGEPAVSEEKAHEVVSRINSLWDQCRLGFFIEKFATVDPGEQGLRYQLAAYPELTSVRSALAEPSRLLVVTTGKWDRSGSIGNTRANAWTSMPGNGPYGIVLEKPVAANANLIAHELGHYLNLPHLNNQTAVMNPIIYARSRSIPEAQCEVARSAVRDYWPKAIR